MANAVTGEVEEVYFVVLAAAVLVCAFVVWVRVLGAGVFETITRGGGGGV